VLCLAGGFSLAWDLGGFDGCGGGNTDLDAIKLGVERIATWFLASRSPSNAVRIPITLKLVRSQLCR